MERLTAVIRAPRHEPLPRMVDAVSGAAASHGRQRDDQTPRPARLDAVDAGDGGARP